MSAQIKEVPSTIAGLTPAEIAAARRAWALAGKCDEQAADLDYWHRRARELEDEILPELEALQDRGRMTGLALVLMWCGGAVWGGLLAWVVWA